MTQQRFLRKDPRPDLPFADQDGHRPADVAVLVVAIIALAWLIFG